MAYLPLLGYIIPCKFSLLTRSDPGYPETLLLDGVGGGSCKHIPMPIKRNTIREVKINIFFIGCFYHNGPPDQRARF